MATFAECTPEQRDVINAVLAGKSVFVTGPGGTGKSFLLEALVKEFQKTGRKIAVTAMTGCAAHLLGQKAKTLHSWAGIGLGRGSLQSILNGIVMNGRRKKNWTKTDCLVVDEVSMMPPSILNLLDDIGRRVRKCFGRPLGGLQVVFVGDFYQLPPVGRDISGTMQFAFQSPVWKSLIERSYELKQIHRQRDPAFQTILNEARRGELSPASYQALLERKTMAWKGQLIRPTLLFTRNANVAEINQSYLAKLPGEPVVFKARTTYAPPGLDAAAVAMREQMLDKDSSYEPELHLKVGAQVMLIHNKDPEAGLINGSRGVVTGFSEAGLPLVRFVSFPAAIPVPPHAWEDDGEPPLKREQIPLRVAYAVTIHKAQGASLDSALVDVGKATFETGQAYVALSRVRSMGALWIYDIDPGAFRVHADVKAFYEELAKEPVLGLPPGPEDPQAACLLDE